MKRNSIKKLLPFILCIVLTAATALCMTGCGDPSEGQQTYATVFSDGTTLGQGALTFTFTVVDLQENTYTAQVSTDKETVGEALLELGLIDGEMGDYGLYIKSVNGIPYDYSKDGAYWGFYINGEYAMSGVDTTDIVPGTTYTLKAVTA